MRISRLAVLFPISAASAALAVIACGSETESPRNDLPDASIDSNAPDQAAPDAGHDTAVPDTSAPDTSTTCSLDGGKTGALCGGQCVDLATDPAHCGTCTLACTPGSYCQNGCVDVASGLQGLRWNLPCTAPYNTTVCVTDAVNMLASTLKGSTTRLYAVTLRFRGIVEQKTYVGSSATDAGLTGTLNTGFYVVGGTPAADDWNIYKLEVSDPAFTAYLNNGASGHNYVDQLDYTTTVTMRGGSDVTLTADPVDNGPYEIKNVSLEDGGAIVVPGVAPAPAAFDGQFVQMDVVSVVPL